MCCRHVIAAVDMGTELTTPAVPLELDFLDDGSLILKVMVCDSCAAAGQLCPRSRVSGKLWEAGTADGTYPWIAPTCHICVNELESRLGR
jgi:hypothetical protein